jgi:hypothetical protein
VQVVGHEHQRDGDGALGLTAERAHRRHLAAVAHRGEYGLAHHCGVHERVHSVRSYLTDRGCHLRSARYYSVGTQAADQAGVSGRGVRDHPQPGSHGKLDRVAANSPRGPGHGERLAGRQP